MANNKGGAREGAGRKAGSSAIKSAVLQETIQKTTKKSYDQIVADVFLKIITKFEEDEDPKHMLAFMKIYTPYLIELPAPEATEDEAQSRADILAAIQALKNA